MVSFLTMVVYNMVVHIFLLAQLFVPLLAAQAIRRLADPHPGLGRRIVGNCTPADTDCQFCAAAVLLTWSMRIFEDPVATITLQEVVNEDGSVDVETMTAGWDPASISYYAQWLQSSAQGPYTTVVEALGAAMTYPTPYVVLPDSYLWKGTLFTDNACSISTDTPAEVAASPTVRPAAGDGNSVLTRGFTDSYGYLYDLVIATETDVNLGANFKDGAFVSCKPGCDDLGGSPAAVDDPPLSPPQLTRAFATACQRSTRGVDGVVKLADGDCTAVQAPSPGSPTGGGNSGSGSGSGSNSAGSGESGNGGGSQGGNDNPTGAGGGGEARVTTTDSGGNTVIMNVGGDNLYASVNAQGQTLVGTGAADAGPMGGQITLADPAGATVVVQGGSLASPGDANAAGITVTDVHGVLMVIQGGQTGTLSAAAGGGTALIVGTLTQTSWVAGATIAGGETGAEPTIQNETGTVRLPSLLELWGFFLSTTLVVAIML